jgi:hypothetical protein
MPACISIKTNNKSSLFKSFKKNIEVNFIYHVKHVQEQWLREYLRNYGHKLKSSSEIIIRDVKIEK